MFVLSSELASSAPSPASECVPRGAKWGQPLLAGEGMRGAISDDLRESLTLYILCGLNRAVPMFLSTYYPLQFYIDLQYLVFTQLLKSYFFLFFLQILFLVSGI